MKQNHKQFRHESLQDCDSIQSLLKAISDGLGEGRIRFSDEDGELVMEPSGLLNLRVTANEEDSQHRLSIRISWQEAGTKTRGKLVVK